MGNCSSSSSEAVAVAAKAPASGSAGTKNNNKGNKQNIARHPKGKLSKRTSRRSVNNNNSNALLIPDEYKDANPAKWKCAKYQFNSSYSTKTEGRIEKIQGKPIAKGTKKFKANPTQYVAMIYPTCMLDWPENEQEYTYIHRAGTKDFKPKGVSNKGQVTVFVQEYQPLPSFKEDVLPKQYRDKYTDNMKYKGKKLHTLKKKPILPGRGMGVVDEPKIKIIGDVDPSDIDQGKVGNCWLLSGIASLAEFDGAIRRLFRKTKNLDQMPFDDGRPNIYTITLWDLTTWKEVDIVVDERLCAMDDGSGSKLLGAKPSADGELWVCYLEKALAAHCGGWDKIDGGQCTHAWALLTGCKDQYLIQKNKKGKFVCYAKYDTTTKKWADHGNSPSEGHQGVWEVPWPQLGGGGNNELDEDELFLRMCAWDDENYLIGAATAGTSDRNKTDGIIDNHAYSVVDCRNDVAGTNIDLIQVRNPWGKGEIEKGMFADKGPGWKKYPQIKKALKPAEDDDGIFWVTKQEFFKHYKSIYLSASDLTRFLKDGSKRH
jgi:hypothetical protein